MFQGVPFIVVLCFTLFFTLPGHTRSKIFCKDEQESLGALPELVGHFGYVVGPFVLNLLCCH